MILEDISLLNYKNLSDVGISLSPKINCFIGSNTSLVAPVTIGEGSLIGAGSVIVEDVPAGKMALGRGRQVIKDRRN